MSDQQDQVDEILKQVLRMETQQAFEYLAASDADVGVINQVAQLLEPSATRTAFLDGRGLLAEVVEADASQDLSGAMINNIKVIEPLGQGGMGAVYLAEDITLKRQVALKALHNNNRISPKAQQRFRREALILSQLDHSNICRIYNLIETADADYLILELIAGETLKACQPDTFSKGKKMDIAEALLSAVHAAHSKNIIHRDLKPENIMLNEQGQLKVLDFGISRLSDTSHLHSNTQSKTRAPNQTEHGAVMGTLIYMSPEQAAGEELTTASDVYTLGLIFQELFSNTPVYDDELTNEQLVKLSTAAKTNKPQDLPADLTALIQRMKAKSPAERPTALDAMNMLGRIKAKPVKRLRMGLVAVVVLFFGLGVYKHINDLNYEREQAQLAQQQAEEVTGFLTSIFEVSNPYLKQAEELTALDLLEKGAEKVDDELADQPELQWILKATIGEVYHLMGLLDRSENLLKPTYKSIQGGSGVNAQIRADIINKYATLVMDLGDFELAEKLFGEAIGALPDKQSEAVLGNKNWLAMIHSRMNRFAQTANLTDEIIAVYDQNPAYDINIAITALNTAGMAQYLQADYASAEASFNRAQKMINETNKEIDFNTEINVMGNLASVYGSTDRLLESSEIRHHVVDLSEQRLPENHPDLIGAYDNLAVDYYFLENLEQAKHWNEKALQVFKRLTEDNQDQDDNFNYLYSITLANYGVLLTRTDDYDKALTVFVEVVERLSEVLGAEHRTVADYLYEMANTHFHLNNFDDTLDLAQQAIAIYEQDQVPLNSRELKSWLLQASVMNERQDYVQVDAIEAEVRSRLSELDAPNQTLSDLANTKFIELKAVRETK